MIRDITENHLCLHVYLGVERQNNPRYNLRPANSLSSFPISGATYFGSESENPQESLIRLLNVDVLPYNTLQKCLDSLYNTVHEADKHNQERILKKVIRFSQELFLKEQAERLSLVGKTLQSTLEKVKTEEDCRHSQGQPPFAQHYGAKDFSAVYDAVINLHRAVQSAGSSFDKLVIGTSFSSADKFEEERSIISRLELATDLLGHLDYEGRKKLGEIKTTYLAEIQKDSKEYSDALRRDLKFD